MPGSDTYFLAASLHLFLKVTTDNSFGHKKPWKFRFWGCFSKAKTEKCDQNDWYVLDQFGITIPCSTTYFLEVGARLSLKVATKGSLRGKKTEKI